jgi:hypothetical protein
MAEKILLQTNSSTIIRDKNFRYKSIQKHKTIVGEKIVLDIGIVYIVIAGEGVRSGSEEAR